MSHVYALLEGAVGGAVGSLVTLGALAAIAMAKIDRIRNRHGAQGSDE